VERRQFLVEAGIFAFVTYRTLIKTVADAAPTTNFNAKNEVFFKK